MEQFTQEMLKRLDALASKLGMAASAIWGFYIRQAKVDGVTYAISGGLLAAVMLLNIGLLVYLLTKKKDYIWGQKVIGRGRTQDKDWNTVEFQYDCRTGGHSYALWWAAPILPLGALSAVLLYQAFSALYNPGYYAFQQIIAQLHGQ